MRLKPDTPPPIGTRKKQPRLRIFTLLALIALFSCLCALFFHAVYAPWRYAKWPPPPAEEVPDETALAEQTREMQRQAEQAQAILDAFTYTGDFWFKVSPSYGHGTGAVFMEDAAPEVIEDVISLLKGLEFLEPLPLTNPPASYDLHQASAALVAREGDLRVSFTLRHGVTRVGVSCSDAEGSYGAFFSVNSGPSRKILDLVGIEPLGDLL